MTEEPLSTLLRAWRAEYRISAVEAADILGVPAATLRGIEYEDYSFRYPKLLRAGIAQHRQTVGIARLHRDLKARQDRERVQTTAVNSSPKSFSVSKKPASRRVSK